MKRVKWNKKHWFILGWGIGAVIIFFVCLCIGRFKVPFVQTVRIVVNELPFVHLEETWEPMMANAVLSVRLPRLLGAALVGAALALSGAAYQGVFKNPLVSPDLLGVSNGACVGAAFSILLGLSSVLIQINALLMGLLTVFLTTRIPKFFRNNSSLMLVLAGVIMSGFMSALIGVAKYVADPEDHLPSIVYWTMGSFSSTRMSDVLLVIAPIIVAGAVMILLRWRINLLSLGEQQAQSMGVNIKKTRGLCILCSTVLTACAVCLSGTIGWVGLIMPHLGRLIIGHDNRYLIPLSAILGAAFMMIVDTIARNLTGSEIPLSIITGLLGAPLFVWLLGKQKARLS